MKITALVICANALISLAGIGGATVLFLHNHPQAGVAVLVSPMLMFMNIKYAR